MRKRGAENSDSDAGPVSVTTSGVGGIVRKPGSHQHQQLHQRSNRATKVTENSDVIGRNETNHSNTAIERVVVTSARTFRALVMVVMLASRWRRMIKHSVNNEKRIGDEAAKLAMRFVSNPPFNQLMKSDGLRHL